jgi:CRP-like cAMP-binding protein
MLDLSRPPTDFAVPRRYRRGSLILLAGDPARTLHVIRVGQVRTYVLDAAGRETTTAVLGAGQVLGVASLLGDATYHAFAEALTPVETWAMPANTLVDRLLEHPELLNAVIEALARRLVLTRTLLRGVTLLPVAERLRELKPLLDSCLGGEQPRVSQEVLAALVGARRETISRLGSASRRSA